MSYRATLEQVKSRSLERRDGARKLRSVRHIGLLYLMLLLTRQRSSLIWTFGLSAVHLVELFALAWCHFIFFPPISLSILRMLSAFSFAAPIASLAARAIDSAMQSDDSDIPSRRERMLRIAIGLVGLCSAASLVILGWITFGTNLHLVTPPIFRALIVATVVVLPLDALISFLISNRRYFAAPTLKRSSRWFGLWCYLAGVGCIVLDLPGFYLVTTLVPRILFARHLWSRATVSAQSRFSKLVPLRTAAAKGYFFRFWRRFGTTVILIGCYELSFYHSFAWFTSTDTNRSLLVFLVHKSMHIAALLAARGALNSATQYAAAIRLGHAQQLRALGARTTAGWAVGFITALFVLPLVLSQKEAIFWLAPTGEVFHLPLAGAGIWCLVAACRSYATLRLLTLALVRYRARDIVLLSSAILIPSVVLAHLSRSLAYRFDIETVFAAYGLIDATLAVGISMLCHRIVSMRFREAGPEDVVPKGVRFLLPRLGAPIVESAGETLPALLTVSTRSDTSDSLLFVETAKESARRYVRGTDSPLLERVSALGCRFAVWGKNGLFIRTTAARSGQVRVDLISEFSAILNAVKQVEIRSCSTPIMTLRELFGSERALSVELYDRAAGSHLSDGKISRVLTAEEQLDGSLDSIRIDSASDWIVPEGASYEEEKALLEFLSALFGGRDALDPASNWLVRSSAGLVHLTTGGVPSTVIYVRPHARGSLDMLRRAAFRANLVDVFGVEMEPRR